MDKNLSDLLTVFFGFAFNAFVVYIFYKINKNNK